LQIDPENEKRRIARNSVFAAIFLTLLKLVVGLETNSLGLISEAAHSALDFLAALMTYFAVRLSDRPPDREHTYGHGKVENLSAFAETLLLIITCGWIIYEAVQRLFYRTSHVRQASGLCRRCRGDRRRYQQVPGAQACRKEVQQPGA
jgi:cation diffusion facilitator family transporter